MKNTCAKDAPGGNTPGGPAGLPGPTDGINLPAGVTTGDITNVEVTLTSKTGETATEAVDFPPKGRPFDNEGNENWRRCND